MRRKDPGAAKRAKKKHQKALKRAQQLARRREAQEQRARQWHARRHDPLAGWAPQVEGIQGLAHRLGTTFFEAARMTDRSGLPEAVWSPQRVRSLPTEELVRRLGTLGIIAHETGFRETFAQDWSMSEAAERAWLPRLGPEATVHDRDFVRLAACELHGRWLPDTPFHEALVSAFLDSLEAHHANEDERALERGLSLWRLLRSRLSEHMRLTDDVDELLDLYEPFSLWPLEFATSAVRAVPRRPELAAPAAKVLDEVVAQFQEERGDGWLSMQGNRARLLAAAGRGEEAERLLGRLIDKYPDHAVGYAVLAELLSLPGAETASRHRALELLEAATARPVKDAEEWNLARHLQELRKSLR
jgi:tetratricopeptide (TPR) repeat protein